MKIQNILTKELEKLGILKETEFIILYGSVSQGKDTPLSDIDVCISLSLKPKERMEVRMKLLGILPEKFDLQIFEDLPLYVQKSVLAGKLLYCKNKKKTILRAIGIIKDYEDFEPVYLNYINRGRKAQ